MACFKERGRVNAPWLLISLSSLFLTISKIDFYTGISTYIFFSGKSHRLTYYVHISLLVWWASLQPATPPYCSCPPPPPSLSPEYLHALHLLPAPPWFYGRKKRNFGYSSMRETLLRREKQASTNKSSRAWYSKLLSTGGFLAAKGWVKIQQQVQWPFVCYPLFQTQFILLDLGSSTASPLCLCEQAFF